MSGARKHNAKGRSSGGLSKPPGDEIWGWLTQAMLKSPAFRALSVNAVKVLLRLWIEHMAHAGTKNGELICPYTNFVDYGVTRRFIRAALSELDQFGFIRISRGEVNGNHKPPNMYRLTWMPAYVNGEFKPTTNEWKRWKEEHIKAYFKQKREVRKNKTPTPDCYKP